MTTVDQLLANAAQRGKDDQLAYAGAFTPAHAFELLQLTPAARLLDVRTRAELDWVGRPAIDTAGASVTPPFSTP